MNTKIIAITMQKGGVGKTTTCASLGVGLAQCGKKVLLVDCDPQSSLSISLGHSQPDSIPTTLSSVMGKVVTDSHIEEKEGIIPHSESVDLLPSNIELAGMEVSLINTISRETILKQYIATVKSDYGYILLNTQPSLGMLTDNALAAADKALPSFARMASTALTARLRSLKVQGISAESASGTPKDSSQTLNMLSVNIQTAMHLNRLIQPRNHLYWKTQYWIHQHRKTTTN